MEAAPSQGTGEDAKLSLLLAAGHGRERLVPMQGLPTGTVTLLFTDIEGSTRLLEEHGDRYATVLADHRRALRDAFAAHDGVEVDTQGDAFFYAFASAIGAVAAASTAQQALSGGPVQVRMGLHTGTPIATDEGYVGIDVHRAARICAAGHGGQIVVSDSTRELLEDGTFHDLGEHRLKDLSEPVRLYQIGDGEFPRLRTLHQTNLPVAPAPFLGRERELAEVLGLLGTSRMLTLTGPGGTGKTRLAAQAAAESAEQYPGGVWWISLAAVRDPALVLDSIAQVLGASDGLADHIAEKELLLLLDNLEQLLEVAPDLADLLSRCSGLRMLVTSREPLRIAAEQEYPVPPFVSEEAVSFFGARARIVNPSFQQTPVVSKICSRLTAACGRRLFAPLALHFFHDDTASSGCAIMLWLARDWRSQSKAPVNRTVFGTLPVSRTCAEAISPAPWPSSPRASEIVRPPRRGLAVPVTRSGGGQSCR